MRVFPATVHISNAPAHVHDRHVHAYRLHLRPPASVQPLFSNADTSFSSSAMSFWATTLYDIID